jgi:coproporphyrinogen III oxidase-like Fe-S oxidoreductase
MTLDALKVALLAAGARSESSSAELHAELEHFLDRQLAADELDAAVAELAQSGLVLLQAERFVATDQGRALMREHWEAFFPA